MRDIEKLHRIVKMQEAFPEGDFTEYINQLENAENYNRFQKGLSVQTQYKKLFQDIPFVKECTPLGEEQTTNQKSKYQIPDYMLSVSKSDDSSFFSLFVDVKNVSNGKINCEVQTKEIRGFQEYCKMKSNTPLLIAIHWEKQDIWTHNCLDNFEHKKKHYKISFFEALQNDLSCILGDYSFLIDCSFQIKKLICNNDISSDVLVDQKYGKIDKVFLKKNNSSYLEIDYLQYAAIDSIMEFKQIAEDDLSIIEKPNIPFMVPKLSYWISRLMSVTNINDLSEEIYDKTFTAWGRDVIFTLFDLIIDKKVFSIPFTKTKTSDELYKEAFGDMSIYKQYCKNS
ncbi:MAG: hypothetical protein SOZ83_01215 [Sphaerochaetaceae bacterium]|nr:hypothetical protein [Sphaerochaetaceae bacterium]